MKFTRLPLGGAYLIDLEKRGDERGFFARVFCEKEFSEHHLGSRFVQINSSTSSRRGTLRGMHYQLPPFAEAKVVRCIRGALFDVILDLRPASPTFGAWHGAELTSENRTMMYVPEGFAHGFITLQADTEAFYLVTASYAPQHERGVRYDDSRFGIKWPMPPAEMSDKDRAWPDYDPVFHGAELLKSLP